jgi:hypothetical protein
MNSEKSVNVAKQAVASEAEQITATIAMARNIKADSLLSPEQLDNKYNPNGDGEHPEYLRSMWREAVVQEQTYDGYWSWVSYCIKTKYESI